MEGQSPPLAIDLHRKSNAEHLVAYIKTHHESLLALLPPDTTCADNGRGQPGVCSYAPRPFASVTHTIYGRWPSGVRGYALSGGHQTVHSVWGYTCRAFRLPNHTLTPTYSESCRELRVEAV